MAILRGCARCGGDILTGDAKNVRCLQCGYRPEVPVAALRRRGRWAAQSRVPRPVDVEEILAAFDAVDEQSDDAEDGDDGDAGARCPRCDDDETIALEKLRTHFNTCFRCRLCGHIFSPAAFRKAS